MGTRRIRDCSCICWKKDINQNENNSLKVFICQCGLHIKYVLFHLHACFCPYVGVSEDRRDLTVEATAERLPGRCQPQAEWDCQPQSISEGKHSKGGDAEETEQRPRRQPSLSHHRSWGQSVDEPIHCSSHTKRKKWISAFMYCTQLWPSDCCTLDFTEMSK